MLPSDHASRLDRERCGDGVAVALGLVHPPGEIIDVLVVLDDLGGDVVASVPSELSMMVVSEEVLLRVALRGGSAARDRHASAAAVGNEIRRRGDAGEAA